ncbi:MAG TPA: hypothetical protein VG015_01195 [Candidatus Dormibacteraeota bacterium]|jgi:hypothetical protein|nr:hypothetical protein [Candidatus Dormibacteraeota bacterium]
MNDNASETIKGWFAGRLPAAWFVEPVEITGDQEEILVLGRLADVELLEAGSEAVVAARGARIDRFREETREERMQIASEAQQRFRRRVSWGAACGDQTTLFTTSSVPVMTRLRISERGVLDTLVAAGVARSRSEALAWCVRLVGKHQADWIKDLRDAFAAVEKVRAEGPSEA